MGGAGAFKRAEATARALVNPKRRGGDMASTHAAAASDTVSTGFEPIAPEGATTPGTWESSPPDTPAQHRQERCRVGFPFLSFSPLPFFSALKGARVFSRVACLSQ